MICQPCRDGAKWNIQWTLVPEGERSGFRSLEQLAKNNHGKCDGRCDCQHVVGRKAIAGREPK